MRKAFQLIGETLFYFCVTVVVLLVLRHLLGIERSIWPTAIGVTLGRLIGKGIGFGWSKRSSKQ